MDEGAELVTVEEGTTTVLDGTTTTEVDTCVELTTTDDEGTDVGANELVETCVDTTLDTGDELVKIDVDRTCVDDALDTGGELVKIEVDTTCVDDTLDTGAELVKIEVDSTCVDDTGAEEGTAELDTGSDRELDGTTEVVGTPVGGGGSSASSAACWAPNVVDVIGHPTPIPRRFWRVIEAAERRSNCDSMESSVGKLTATGVLLTANPAFAFAVSEAM